VIVLDTHVLAWADNDERKLGRKAKTLIDRFWNGGNVSVCAISWTHPLIRHDART